MSVFGLNFVHRRRWLAGYPDLLLILFVAVLLALTVYLAGQWQQAEDALQQQQATLSHTRSSAPKVAVDPAAVKAAKAIQMQLAVGWLNLLPGLEQAMQPFPNIYLLKLAPNPAQRQLLMTVETDSFDNIPAWLAALSTVPGISAPHMLSQHWQDASGYVIEVQMGWLP